MASKIVFPAAIRMGESSYGELRKLDVSWRVVGGWILARMMVGRDGLLQVPKEPVKPQEMMLRIEGLSTKGLEAVHLRLRQGETVAVVEVAGTGQKPLVETVSSLRRPTEGKVIILGKSGERFHAGHSRDGNRMYIQEDRRGLATCLDLDSEKNRSRK